MYEFSECFATFHFWMKFSEFWPVDHKSICSCWKIHFSNKEKVIMGRMKKNNGNFHLENRFNKNLVLCDAFTEVSFHIIAFTEFSEVNFKKDFHKSSKSFFSSIFYPNVFICGKLMCTRLSKQTCDPCKMRWKY